MFLFLERENCLLKAFQHSRVHSKSLLWLFWKSTGTLFFTVFFFVSLLKDVSNGSLGVWLKPCSLTMHIEWTDRHCWLAFHVLKERERGRVSFLTSHHSPIGVIASQVHTVWGARSRHSRMAVGVMVRGFFFPLWWLSSHQYAAGRGVVVALRGTAAAGRGCLQLQSGLPSFRVLQSGRCWVTSPWLSCPSR